MVISMQILSVNEKNQIFFVEVNFDKGQYSTVIFYCLTRLRSIKIRVFSEKGLKFRLSTMFNPNNHEQRQVL